MACVKIPICELCKYEFNETYVIPLVLRCNHTFCKPCITKLSQMNMLCPKCQYYIHPRVSDFPINSSLLLVPRPNSVKNYYLNLKNQDFALHILKLYSSLPNKTDEVSKNTEETDDSNLQNEPETKVKNENDGEDSKQLQDKLNSKYPLQFTSLDIMEAHGFFQSVYNRIKKGEEIYTCLWKLNVKKFGKISINENKILFHSLDLLDIPSNSSIIMLKKIKHNLLSRKLYSFIKLRSNKNTSVLVVIEMLRNDGDGLTNQFIHLCTGEDGESYKNYVQVRVSNGWKRCCTFDDCTNLLHVLPEPGIPVYDRDIYGDYEDGIIRKNITDVTNDTVFLEHFYMNGWFSLVSSVKCPEERIFIGRVIDPPNLYELLAHNDVPNVKILDCGLSVRV
ncbi:UNVERIFIED_CONTAM: hypothetical protein RMT77_010901 [Armadillidium vulgare]